MQFIYTSEIQVPISIQLNKQKRNKTQSTIGEVSFHVTADPLNVDHLTYGSPPILSDVDPDADVVASTGSVIGSGTEQLFPLAPTSTLTIELASVERVYLIEGAHLSRAMRFVNSLAILSWVIEMIGHVVLFDNH